MKVKNYQVVLCFRLSVKSRFHSGETGDRGGPTWIDLTEVLAGLQLAGHQEEGPCGRTGAVKRPGSEWGGEGAEEPGKKTAKKYLTPHSIEVSLTLEDIQIYFI